MYLDSISFDDSGLDYQGKQLSSKLWLTESEDAIVITCLPEAFEEDYDPRSVASIRESYHRNMVELGGAIVEVDKCRIDSCDGVRWITKTPKNRTFIGKLIRDFSFRLTKAPQDLLDMTYLSGLTFPFRDFTIDISIVCLERGMTGMRDSHVLKEKLSKGEIAKNKSGKIIGWWKYPYDETFTAPVMRNLSDNDKYDGLFPDHPLSRGRLLLNKVHSTLCFAEEIKSQPGLM